APEIFAWVTTSDSGRRKQLQRGLDELAEEGVVQLLYRTDLADSRPHIGAVGALQLEVHEHRLATEYDTTITTDVTDHVPARRTDESSANRLRATSGVDVYRRTDGTLLALFSSERWCERVALDSPDLILEPVLAA